MRIRVTLAVVLIGIMLAIGALFPIKWEFVNQEFDPLIHMLGSGFSTMMFGVVLYYPLIPRLSLRCRAVFAFVFALAIWVAIELAQIKIPLSGTFNGFILWELYK